MDKRARRDFKLDGSWPVGSKNWKGDAMLYEYECLNGHRRERFEHHPDDKGCETIICDECGHTMGPVPSYGRGLLYFEEGRARTIWNLGPEPVTIRSHKEHLEAMKKAGVAQAGAEIVTTNNLRRSPRKITAKGRWI